MLVTWGIPIVMFIYFVVISGAAMSSHCGLEAELLHSLFVILIFMLLLASFVSRIMQPTTGLFLFRFAQKIEQSCPAVETPKDKDDKIKDVLKQIESLEKEVASLTE